MPSEVQWRGGNTSQNNNFTGAEREISVNEDTHSLRVHDGATAGGYELARADLSNAVGIVSITASGSIAADSGFNIGISSSGSLVTSGPLKTLNFIGAGNTFSVDGSKVDISVSGVTDISYDASTQTLSSSSGIGTTLPLVSSSTAGLVPATGGGTTNFLRADGTFAAPPGGNPGGSDTQIQFNDGGSFGGSADLTWDDTGKVLGVGGDVDLDDGGTYTTTLQTITATANRTISLPDATGTVALVAGSSGQVLYNLNGANAGLSSLTADGSGNLTFSARWIQSVNGAADAPASTLTGTWFTGGTATTTKPHFLIEPAGTTSTAWSTSGTGLGVNAPSGFTGNLLDLQVNGTSQARLSNTGVASIGGVVLANGGILQSSSFNDRIEFGNSSASQWRLRLFANNHLGLEILRDEGVSVLSTRYFGWTTSAGTSADLQLYRDASDTLAQRRNTNAQTFRLYNTFTSATNFERLNVRWASNEAILDTEAGGDGGTLRGLKIGSASTSLLGFYGATPVDQPDAVADLTTTATVGSLPTPDGSVTIADATSPTNAELLEYCVELEAKLEAALSRLRELGLIAS